MSSVNVLLNSIEKVKSFVNLVTTYEGDYDLASDRHIVDAKSIMGIFSLDLTKTLRLDIHDDNELEKIKAALKDYIV
ncbi:MAG: HPr family phosphocarrier protein [Clostridiales bacterium]|jgi:phosphotransferase system HPr-like phosphotransfer protein|nr:HPr family phosphocarrier protein [Clostridiales bacterium]